jgi:hypothetical protein
VLSAVATSATLAEPREGPALGQPGGEPAALPAPGAGSAASTTPR